MTRWDVVDIDFGVPEGHEQGARRPGIVVSYNALLKAGLVIVCPVTSTIRRPYPGEVPIPSGVAGLTKPSICMPEHLRSVALSRVASGRGHLSDPRLREAIEAGMRRVLGLSGGQ